MSRRELSWSDLEAHVAAAEQGLREYGAARLFAAAARVAQDEDRWAERVSRYLERLAEEEVTRQC